MGWLFCWVVEVGKRGTNEASKSVWEASAGDEERSDLSSLEAEEMEEGEARVGDDEDEDGVEVDEDGVEDEEEMQRELKRGKKTAPVALLPEVISLPSARLRAHLKPFLFGHL